MTVDARIGINANHSMSHRIRFLLAPGAVALLLSACSSEPPSAPASSAEPAQSSESAPAAAALADEAALEPLFGTWALDPARCDGPVLKISRARFEGAENGCDIDSFSDNGDGSFTASLTCAAQDTSVAEEIRMRPLYAPTGEGIDLTYLNRENLETTVLRCPAPVAAP